MKGALFYSYIFIDQLEGRLGCETRATIQIAQELRAALCGAT